MLASDPNFLPLIPLLGTLLGGLCLWATFRAARCQRLVEDIPTSKTTGVFIGYVEIEGTAEAEQPLTSYLAAEPCVQYQWNVEEHWSRTVTETYTDSQGRTKTRTRRESGWTTVADGGQIIPFYLRDDCGVIRILPQGATIEPAMIFRHTCGRSDPLYYAKGPARAVSDSDHRRRFVEQAIPLHQPLYVLGQAREREDVVAAELASDPHAPLFLISTRSQAQVRSGYQQKFWGWLVFGGILCVGGWLAHDLAADLDPGRRWPLYLLAAGSYTLVAVLCWVWMVYNSLVELRHRVRQAWAQVDVQLKRRHDLIPGLVAIVRGLGEHERNVQRGLAELRSQLAATAPGAQGQQPRALANTVQVLAERYPELTVQRSFVDLHGNLVDTEHRIALARGYFNDIATFYNTRLQRVPDCYVAHFAALQRQPLLAATDFQREPVDAVLVP